MATLRKQVSDALVLLGYRRHGRAHVRRVDDDFSLCVDTGPIGLRTDIAPFVGIRSDAVERARAELMSLSDDEWIGTVGANVGYVLGGAYRWWNEGAPPGPIVDDILAGLERFSPYMSLETIADAFAHDWAAGNPGAPYARVVIALLNGDPSRVVQHLADAESVLCARADAVCDQFRAFDARVRARLVARHATRKEG
jgi:hypothetical protein